MNGKENSFRYKMKKNLVYRVWTVIAVTVVPICLVAVLMMILAMTSAGRQLENSYQHLLDKSMTEIEQGNRNLQEDMEDFVKDHLNQLNARNGGGDEIVHFAMLSELEKILKGSDQYGLVAIYDHSNKKTLVQSNDAESRARENDLLMAEIRQLIEADLLPQDMSRQNLQGSPYLVRAFSYQNYDVCFWLDMNRNLSEALAQFRIDEDHIYISDSFEDTTVYELMEDGSAKEMELSWEECSRTSVFSRNISWKSASLPLQVMIKAEKYGLHLVPVYYWFLLIPALGSFSMIFFLGRLLRLEILEPFQKLAAGMKHMEDEDLGYRLDDHYYRNSDEVQYLFDSFDHMAAEVESSKEKDKKMFQSELDNLRLQVNPHMLLNSFNMIYSLAQSKNYECIQEYAFHLGDYFRYALKKNDRLVTLVQEMEFVQNYIEIQKIRFPSAFATVYNVAEGCEQALIPPLLIENFVENAMKYALVPGKTVEVLLNVRREEDRLLISVCDTGRGIKPEVMEKLQCGEPYVDKLGNKHIGVWNCRRRIELFYDEPAAITITSEVGAGTQIFIDLPFVLEEKENEAFDRR